MLAEGGSGELLFNENSISLWEDEKFVTNGSDGLTKMIMYIKCRERSFMALDLARFLR